MDDPDYWFPPPVALTLPLSRGQWISVRRDLTWGEQQDAFKRASVDGAADALLYVTSTIVAYLIDWSLRDADGPIVIRGASAEEVTRVLCLLSRPAFAEIRDAIDAHAAARGAHWDQEKKIPSGTPGDAATSSSPSEPAGALTGSVN